MRQDLVSNLMIINIVIITWIIRHVTHWALRGAALPAESTTGSIRRLRNGCAYGLEKKEFTWMETSLRLRLLLLLAGCCCCWSKSRGGGGSPFHNPTSTIWQRLFKTVIIDWFKAIGPHSAALIDGVRCRRESTWTRCQPHRRLTLQSIDIKDSIIDCLL